MDPTRSFTPRSLASNADSLSALALGLGSNVANVAEVILPECSQLISAIVAEVILPLCNPELPLPLRNWHGFESPK